MQDYQIWRILSRNIFCEWHWNLAIDFKYIMLNRVWHKGLIFFLYFFSEKSESAISFLPLARLSGLFSLQAKKAFKSFNGMACIKKFFSPLRVKNFWPFGSLKSTRQFKGQNFWNWLWLGTFFCKVNVMYWCSKFSSTSKNTYRNKIALCIYCLETSSHI